MAIDASQLSEVLPRRSALPHTSLSLGIEVFFSRLAKVVSWVWLLLMAVIVVNVVMRYIFGQGRIEFEEIQWHLYAIGFLVGLATCMAADNHIRVDVLHDRLSLRMQAWIELYGLILLFFPFVAMMLLFSLPFVEYSWQIAEVSDAPGGLPFRWAIKGVLPASMFLLLVAGTGRIARVSAFLFGSPRTVTHQDSAGVD